LLDWQLPDGRIATLHSDQVIRRGRKKVQRFTEIVVLETAEGRNALVLLDGEEPQFAGALETSVQNASGAILSARYPTAMAPFTVHRIELASLFPALADFAGGEPLLVSGKGIGSRENSGRAPGRRRCPLAMVRKRLVFNRRLAQSDAFQFDPGMGIELVVALSDAELQDGIEASPVQQPIHQQGLSQACRRQQAAAAGNRRQCRKALR